MKAKGIFIRNILIILFTCVVFTSINTSASNNWIRYNNTNNKFVFEGDAWFFYVHGLDYFYNGDSAQTTNPNSLFKFQFEGTGFRYICQNYDTRSKNIEVKIDGVVAGHFKLNTFPWTSKQPICYTATGLNDGVHKVEIRSVDTTGTVFVVDAIDIDGTLLDYEEDPQPSTRALKVVLELNEQLQLAVDDDITENTKMNWTSSDPTATTVDSNGLIKAFKKGNTIITVKSADNSYTEEIKVLVVDNMKDYRLTIDLKVGEKCRLSIDDAQDLVGNWTSLDADIATVTDKGRVTAVGAGLTLITGYDKDGNEVGQVYIRVK